MTFPYYASAEQIMRDRAELARKGIARGRSVVILTYADGVLFVADNASNTLRKVSELYDRIGFAAVGKYNEFDQLRKAGIRAADTRGYSYDRADVTGLSLANAYSTALGQSFTEQTKPFEVELCVADVAPYRSERAPQLYRITYDGSIADEKNFVVMGGSSDTVAEAMRASYQSGAELAPALRGAVSALAASAGPRSADKETELKDSGVEVAILDAARPRRAFRRLTGDDVGQLLS